MDSPRMQYILGCNILFILIIYYITEEIENLDFRYKYNNFKISSLFYIEDMV